jgi:hypothetical protein
VRSNLAIQPVKLASHVPESDVIVALQGGIPLLLELAHFRFDRRLVDAFDVMVFMRGDPERLAQGR